MSRKDRRRGREDHPSSVDLVCRQMTMPGAPATKPPMPLWVALARAWHADWPDLGESGPPKRTYIGAERLTEWHREGNVVGRGVEQRQLVGLITRRSEVRILSPQPSRLHLEPRARPPGVLPCPAATSSARPARPPTLGPARSARHGPASSARQAWPGTARQARPGQGTVIGRCALGER